MIEQIEVPQPYNWEGVQKVDKNEEDKIMREAKAATGITMGDIAKGEKRRRKIRCLP